MATAESPNSNCSREQKRKIAKNNNTTHQNSHADASDKADGKAIHALLVYLGFEERS